MINLPGECSHRRADLVHRFNVGAVLLLSTPPACAVSMAVTTSVGSAALCSDRFLSALYSRVSASFFTSISSLRPEQQGRENKHARRCWSVNYLRRERA
jgi:hypothetical protein